MPRLETVARPPGCGVTASDLGWTGGDTVTVRIVAPRPRVSLVLSPNPISEDSGESTVSATLDRPSSAETTITVSASAVSPATASHFTVSSNKVLTIAAGKMDSTGTVTITAANNAADDDNRRVTVSGTAANTAGVTAPGDATLTIFDDESASTKVTLTVSPKSVQEDATGAARTVTVTAELNRDARVQATDVTVSVAAGTAVEGTDYTAVPEFTFTIAPGATSGTGTFTLAPIDDSLDEPGETVTVTATTVAGLSVVPAVGLTVTIVDDDSPPKVTLVLTPTSIPEDGGESVVTATLNRPSAEDVTVTVTATPVDPATADDFTLSGSVLTIVAGDRTSTGTVTITANANSDAAEDKKVTVSGMATSAGEVTAPQDVTLTITEDDEASATVTLTVDRATVAEDAAGSDRTVTVTATLDRGAQTENTEVTVSVTGDTAAEGTDYTAVNDFTVTIQAGETSGTGTFTLAPVDDPVDEPAETVVLTGTTTTGLVVLPAGGVTVTITDNDPEPRVRLELSDRPISEANGMTTVTATLDNPSSAVTTITVRVVTPPFGGAARRDFTLSSNPVLTIAAGETMSTGTVTITAVDNDVHAPNKAVQVLGRAENSVGVRNPSALILTLAENDVASTKVTLDLSPVSVSEGGGARAVTVTATLDEAARPSVTPVTISVSGDSAEAGTDFSVVQDFTLNIGARQSSGSATFTLTPLEDEVDEPAETVTVTGATSNSVGLPVELPSGLAVTITDNDPTPRVTLVLGPASIGENGGESTVSATLDRPSSEDTTVTVSAAPGTGTTTSDFTLTGTTLTIAAGDQMSTGTVTVTAEDNQVPALAKSVTVSGTAANDQGGDGAVAADADDHRRRIGVDQGDADRLPGERRGERGAHRPDGDGDRAAGRRRPDGGHGGDRHGVRRQRGGGDGLHGGASVHADDRGGRYGRHRDVHPQPGGRRDRRAGPDGDRPGDHDLQPERGARLRPHRHDRRRRPDAHRHPGADPGVDPRGRRLEHGDRDPRPPVERGHHDHGFRVAGGPGDDERLHPDRVDPSRSRRARRRAPGRSRSPRKTTTSIARTRPSRCRGRRRTRMTSPSPRRRR